MSPALGSHLLATDTESFPALGSLSLACHSGLVHVLGCGAEGYEDLLLPPTNQKPLKHKSVYGLVEACGACVIQAHAVHARMCTQMAGNQPDPRREACPAVVFVLDAGG